jgi:hypothetical protein
MKGKLSNWSGRPLLKAELEEVANLSIVVENKMVFNLYYVIVILVTFVIFVNVIFKQI